MKDMLPGSEQAAAVRAEITRLGRFSQTEIRADLGDAAEGLLCRLQELAPSYEVVIFRSFIRLNSPGEPIEIELNVRLFEHLQDCEEREMAQIGRASAQ